jgi:hypothetical protein
MFDLPDTRRPASSRNLRATEAKGAPAGVSQGAPGPAGGPAGAGGAPQSVFKQRLELEMKKLESRRLSTYHNPMRHGTSPPGIVSMENPMQAQTGGAGGGPGGGGAGTLSTLRGALGAASASPRLGSPVSTTNPMVLTPAASPMANAGYGVPTLGDASGAYAGVPPAFPGTPTVMWRVAWSVIV